MPGGTAAGRQASARRHPRRLDVARFGAPANDEEAIIYTKNVGHAYTAIISR
jgi:hypothetical protein